MFLLRQNLLCMFINPFLSSCTAVRFHRNTLWTALSLREVRAGVPFSRQIMVIAWVWTFRFNKCNDKDSVTLCFQRVVTHHVLWRRLILRFIQDDNFILNSLLLMSWGMGFLGKVNQITEVRRLSWKVHTPTKIEN